MLFELFVADRYLRTKNTQAFISLITFLSTAGVVVGVMALITVIAVMSGAEADLESRILGVTPHVIITRHGGYFTNFPRVIGQLKEISGVKTAEPFIYMQAMVRSGSGVSSAVLKGITAREAGLLQNGPDVALMEKSGEGLIPGIFLGKVLARDLGVVGGDMVFLVMPRGIFPGTGSMPGMRKFRVAEIFETGMYEYDKSLAYIHLDEAKKFPGMRGAVTGIDVWGEDIYSASTLAESISGVIGFQYWVRDWMQINKNWFASLKMQKSVMFIIFILIILVAAFNVASVLIMMVMEKTRDIAILRAMGATRKSIRRIFVLKGLTIGLIGTFVGVCLGFLLCTVLKHVKIVELPEDVYFFTRLPVQMEVLDVFMIASSAIIICFLATLYPAQKASKLDPIEGIRES